MFVVKCTCKINFFFFVFFRWDSEINSKITDQIINDVYGELNAKFTRDIVLGNITFYLYKRKNLSRLNCNFNFFSVVFIVIIIIFYFLAGCKVYFKSVQRTYREETNNPEKCALEKLKKKYRARKQRVSVVYMTLKVLFYFLYIYLI